EVVVGGGEREPRYDGPPLSKAVLAGGEPELLDPEWYAGVDLRLGVRATALRPGELHTTAGPVGFDGLVLACGSEPLELPGTGVTLRTLDDARRLRAGRRPGARVVLVGASWIGAAGTPAAPTAGCAGTVLEAGPAPLAMSPGEAVGRHTAAWYAAAGAELRTGTKVSSVDGDGVQLVGGERVPADLVLVGIGVRPATGWLADSGLELDRGVRTDAAGRTNLPGVVAAGDCAARWSPRAGRYLRGEHWDEALHSPGPAVAALLGLPDDAADPVPYVWSEQFGRYPQGTGSPDRLGRPGGGGRPR